MKQTEISQTRSGHGRISEQVRRFGLFSRTVACLLGIARWAVASMGIWIFLFLVDNLLVLPGELRLPLALGGAIITGVIFIRKALLPALQPENIKRSAVSLERKLAIPENLLINALLFEQTQLNDGERAFARKTITQSEALIDKRKNYDRTDLRRYRRWGMAVAVLLALWVIYLGLFPNYAGNAFKRFSRPMADVPPVDDIALQIIPGGDLALLEGRNLLVKLRIESRSGKTRQISPIVVWREGKGDLEASRKAGKSALFNTLPGDAESYEYVFPKVTRPFAFRAFAGNTYSRSIRVSIIPVPRIKKSLFRVLPPEYTGLPSEDKPGPPTAMTCLEGSRVSVDIVLDHPVDSVAWTDKGGRVKFNGEENSWSTPLFIPRHPGYTLTSVQEEHNDIELASGMIGFTQDAPPRIDFLVEDRNRFVNPGTEVSLGIKASDDYGIKSISISSRSLEENGPGIVLKTWNYLGPPGSIGPLEEFYDLPLTPGVFIPGNTYLVRAECLDFNPRGTPGYSRPLILRIRTPGEITFDDEDPLARAIGALKKAIQFQTRANSLTNNIRVNIEEITTRRTADAHRKAMRDQQAGARDAGDRALRAFRHLSADNYAVRLAPLVNGEMEWILADIAEFVPDNDNLAAVAGRIEKRQQYVLQELVALLGELATRMTPDRESPESNNTRSVSVIAAENDLLIDLGKELKDELEDFIREQKRTIELTGSLADKGPEDLTDEEEEILGELAREQAKWANIFQERLTDFSKLPMQDFADGAVAEEYNEVYQEIKLAEKALYDKNAELAVPSEQAGVEAAEELLHNLERWLPDTPDNTKWMMEEPLAPPQIPLAELPAELEDIVGELIDSEEAMTEDVEDVTSSWMDSLDKGAGWEASDGPISNMSAKGVTGNLLPNEEEIGGRAGEGRSGRSHGQMVEESAEGKGGRDTPTRLTPSPFEQGSVEDSSTDPTGGATGGGKLSGATGEGLRGPTPPAVRQEMARLAGAQSEIRQKAEALDLKLKSYNIPTGDLESSISQMTQFERAARAGKASQLRQAHSEIIDRLYQSKRRIKEVVRARREKNRLSETVRHDIRNGLREGIPKGYEEMTSEYFKVLAEGKVDATDQDDTP